MYNKDPGRSKTYPADFAKKVLAFSSKFQNFASANLGRLTVANKSEDIMYKMEIFKVAPISCLDSYFYFDHDIADQNK